MTQRMTMLRLEPYRWLFPLGVFMAIGGVGHWLFYAVGWMPKVLGFMHAAIQVQLYLACILSGFLMTAIPRFSDTPQASSREAWGTLLLILVLTAAIFTQIWALAQAIFILWLLFLGRFILSRFTARKVTYPPTEFVWILPAFAFGIAGSLIMLLYFLGYASAEWMLVGRALQEQGLMLSLVLGVGGFLGPRLMGVHRVAFGQRQDTEAAFRRKVTLHFITALFLAASFVLERYAPVSISYGLRALVVLMAMSRTRSLNAQVLRAPGLFVRFLSASFWSIALGYVLIAFFPVHRVALLHLVFLGGFSLMIFFITTMVVLNHSGNGAMFSRPIWILHLGGWGLMSSLLLRVFSGFFPESYFPLLGLSAGLWLVTACGWLFFAAPFLLAGGADYRHHTADAC